MTLTLIIFVLLIHFLADFGLQTHQQATEKSNCPHALLSHTGVYSLVWLFASYTQLGNWALAFAFAFITFIAHTLTDLATSNIGKPFWEKKDPHNGFVVVGFDQVLHYIQLFLTFQLFL